MSSVRLRAAVARRTPRTVHIAPIQRSVPILVVVFVLLASAWLGQRASLFMVVGLYGAIVFGVLRRWPALALPGLLVAAAVVPFRIGTGTESTVDVAILGVAGLTGLWLFDLFVRRDLHLSPSYANLPWMALVVVAGLSVVAGSALWNPWVTTKTNFLVVQAAQWGIYVLSACAFWLTGNFAPSRRVLKFLVALVLVLGVLLIGSQIIPMLAAVSRWLLLGSTFFRIWFVALATSLGLFHDGLDRRVRILLVLVALVAIVAARQSGVIWQSGWLPPLVAFGVAVAIRVGRGPTRVAVVVAMPGIALLVAFLLLRIAEAENWSLQTREVAWRGLLDLLANRWVFGLGLASYWHYWRGVIGSMEYLDPATGFLHYTYDPTVNMHNNYMDILGQMGVVGVAVLAWLILALFRQIRRQLELEHTGFGRAYVAAALAAFVGMLFSGMLADWLFPFVYNIGLAGFRDSFVGWMLLGGLVALDATRTNNRTPETARAPVRPL